MKYKFGPRHRKLWFRRNKDFFVYIIGTCLGVLITWFLMTNLGGYRVIKTSELPLLFPCPTPAQTPVQEPTASPSATPRVYSYTGMASYYSVDGCLGCNKNRVMANGEVLDDSKKTVAINFLPLNTYVKLTNLKNGLSVKAKVTDTGGFGKYNRIADMSLATKKAVACSDLCLVELQLNDF